MTGDLLLLILISATFAIGLLGSIAGLVLGNLRLPLLLATLPPAVAGGTNITISGAGAGAGALTHLKAGRFDREAFVAMAPPSVVGAIVGGLLAGWVPGTLLLVVISAIVIEQGYELLRFRAKAADERAGSEKALSPSRRRWAIAAAGLAIGLLGGLVGLILGTIRLPALLRAGVGVKDAVGTNLAVGVLVGIAGLAGHLAGGTVDLWLALYLVPSAVVGAFLGARLTGKLSEATLRRTVGGILIGVGVVLLLGVGLAAAAVSAGMGAAPP
ncbi:MAG: sulfite exporter TauE/SafE family protein [Thermoplasmata archaeon]|nr:sulfite exporter TauE/SafE family protein [Thermoplasmata archaeon]